MFERNQAMATSSTRCYGKEEIHGPALLNQGFFPADAE
jgi:hypothetical protein